MTEGVVRDVKEVMDDLRRNVARWKTELARLQGEGLHSTAEGLSKVIADAEKVLSRWDHPN